MNKASQEALFHATNQGLLGIRQAEINYYLSINAAFGTQAALIGGFTYGIYTQNPLNPEIPGVQFFADVYWFLAAITIAFSVHVVLVTMMLQVLGQGLALHGPIGSMAIATHGMQIEQQQITVSFTLMMIFFVLNTMCVGWVVFSIEGAAACTVVFIVAARYWYYYCERIYLRFYWEQEGFNWKDRSKSMASHGEHGDNPADVLPIEKVVSQGTTANPLTKSVTNNNETNSDQQQQQQSSNPQIQARVSIQLGNTNQTKIKKKKKPFFKFLFAKFATKSRPEDEILTEYEDESDSNYKPPTQSDENIANQIRESLSANDLFNTMAMANAQARGIVMEGYLTTKITKWVRPLKRSKVTETNKSVWERRYFALTSSALMFCYKSRQLYRDDPKSPIYTRPLNLSDFYVRVDNMDQDQRIYGESAAAMANDDADDYYSETDGVGGPGRGSVMLAHRASQRTGGIIPYRFQIALIPQANEEHDDRNQHRHDWVLRCDTEEELLIWVGIMREVSPSSFRD